MGDNKTRVVLVVLAMAFVLLSVAFSLELWCKPPPVRQVPSVDPEFLKTETWRRSYADLLKLSPEELTKQKLDIDVFDCYTCHEEGKKLELKYDKNKQLVIPEEHEDIKMGHGTHGRNNNCFNCHNDENLRQLQARDGRELKLEESTPLCGSCHGPTYRDWEAGSHGRTSGFWNRTKEGKDRGPSDGPYVKQNCVNCHNPHSPKFPGRKPAPSPNYLHEAGAATESTSTEH